MASGALPPGFPAVEIDGEHYLDGGLVSNTPLQYVLEYYPRRSRLCFQVDLFQAHGKVPGDLEQVQERINDIRYSSRTRVNTDAYQQMHEVRHAIVELEKLLPPEIAATDEARRLHALGCVTEMDIVQLIYRPSNAMQDGSYRKLRVELVDDEGQPLRMQDEKHKQLKYDIIARDGYRAKQEVE